ncbi:MAG: YrdB family protein [Chloroflexota bacterium]|nr:YrdB family protein [Chloroflexota bacterium]
MAQANLALRFLLELGAIVAVAYWGYYTGPGGLRWVLAVGAPVVLIVVWALVIAPGAGEPIPQQARALLGSAVLLAAAAALYVVGQTTAALVFAALIVLNTVLMFAFGE